MAAKGTGTIVAPKNCSEHGKNTIGVLIMHRTMNACSAQKFLTLLCCIGKYF